MTSVTLTSLTMRSKCGDQLTFEGQSIDVLEIHHCMFVHGMGMPLLKLASFLCKGAHMAWESWRVGELPLDSRGFPIPVWKHLLPAFPDVSRKVKLALPCIGAHALGAGLRDMHWQGVGISHAWDVDTSLLLYLMAVYGPIDPGGTVGGIC